MKKIGLLAVALGVIGYIAYAYANPCDKQSYFDAKAKKCVACPENATCNGKTFGCKKGYQKKGSICEFKTADTCFYDTKVKEWGRKCLYASGTTQDSLCFVRAWPASDTKTAACSISRDKHSVIAKNGRCQATYYVAKTCQ